MRLTDTQIAYLAGRRLGRPATVGPRGTPQDNPVSFGYNPVPGPVL